MKKILLSFAMLLTGVGAWAQETVSYEVSPTSGTGVGSGWTKTWTYTVSESNPAELVLSCSNNDMSVIDGSLRLASGTAGNETYTLSVPYGYQITGYEFTFAKSGTYTDVLTISAGGTAYTTENPQTITVSGLAVRSTSFTISGVNNSIKTSNFVVSIKKLPTTSITYNFILNGDKVSSIDVLAVIGEEFPSVTLPVGFTATFPTGTVPADAEAAGYDVTCTIIDNYPVEIAADKESITKWYTLRGKNNSYVYSNGSNIVWEGATTDYSDEDLWGFVGNPFNLQIINKKDKLGITSPETITAASSTASLTETPSEYMLVAANTSGQFSFMDENENYLNVQNGTLGYWTDNAGGSMFVVGIAETVVEIPAENGFATLCLGYQASIPEDVNVYVVSGTTETSATLQKVTDIIPANTGVILENAGTHSFKITSGTPANIQTNYLFGTTTKQTIAKESGYTYYVLAKEGTNIGFYEAVKDDNENEFINAAGKAYLKVPVASGARFLLFDFGTETAIESIEGAENADAVVYDLAGRRVKGAQKGLYIVNGKVVIK